MVYALYFSCLLYNGVFAYTKKHSKIIVYATMIFIILIMGWNAGTLDNINYLSTYNNIRYEIFATSSSDFGFIWLIKLGNKLGLDWFSFKFMMSILCVPLIYSTVRLFTKNANFVYFFYLMHSFFMDAEQFRNYIALAIFIYAFRFLLKDNMKSKILYVLFVLVATSIHSSFIVYLPLLLIRGSDKNKLVKGVAIFSLLLCLVTFLNGNRIPLIDNVLNYLQSIDTKAAMYLNSTTRYGFLIPFFLHTFNFITVYIGRKYANKCVTHSLNVEQKRYIDFIFWVNVFAFAFFPLYMQTTTFYRLSRNLILLNFIALSICNDTLGCEIKKKFYLNSLIYLNVSAWFIYDLLIRANEVLIPIFKQNLFLK